MQCCFALTRLVAFTSALVLTNAAFGQASKPDSLLAVDQNRRVVVDRVIAQWGPALESSDAPISAAQLREMLDGLRADHLFAASLAGSLAGLRDVLATSVTSAAPVKGAGVATKALGDAADDLVYTPVTPCRLFDTRLSQAGLGSLSPGGLRIYGATTPVSNQGGPGGCAAPAGAVVAMILIGTVTPSGSGLLQGGPQGAVSFPNALILYQPGDQYGTSVAMPLNSANGQFAIVAQFAATEAYGDLLGYFRPATGFSPKFAASGITGSASIASGGAVNHQFLSNGQAITASRSGTGSYVVTFPGVTVGSANFVQTIQVTPNSVANVVCVVGVQTINSVIGSYAAAVTCTAASTGAATDASFWITFAM